MSIETLLQEQTAAIRENTSAMHQLIAAIGSQVYAEVSQPADKKPAKPSVSIKNVEEKPAPVETPEADTPEADAATRPALDPETLEPKVEDTTAVTRDDAAAAITNLARAKGRPAAVAILEKFGASRLPEVADENIAAVHKAAVDALGGAK